MASLANVTSLAHVQELAQGKQLAVLHFWATWCQPCQQMDAVLAQLAPEHPQVAFLRVEAEVVDEASLKYAITSVPTIILTQAGGAEVSRVEGADPAAVVAALQAALQSAGTSPAAPAAAAPAAPAAATATAVAADDGIDPGVVGRIKWLLQQQPVMLFMKGSEEAPRCGFSSRVVRVLHELQVPFGYFDILSDDAIRAGLKQWSNWPTFPQLYVKGELLGGCDIVEEMKASGELQQLLASKLGANYATAAKPPAPAASAAAAAPTAVPASSAPSGDASQALDPGLHARLSQLVQQQPVMLFMKGTPEAPRCGFSRKVAAALQGEHIPFGHFDILSDEAVRQGLKAFSNWPTFPQLYVKGELLGGCDIVLQMQEGGELGSAVQEMLHRA